MGEVIQLHERRARRAGGPPRERSRAAFYFDLACPFTYLAAERVDRAFDEVVWTPASDGALRRTCLADDAVAAAAVRRAAEVRAAEHGRAGAFVLAAGRLAFCGGFDLDDPEILAEAAAAAGIPLIECFAAAGDTRRDGAAEAVGRKLLAAGADRLPVLRVGRSLFWGEQRVGAAAASVRQASPALARRGV